MQAFRYRFAQLLEWRRSQLELEKAALATLHGERSAIDRSIAGLEESAAQSTRLILESRCVTGAELGDFAEYRDHVRQELRLARSRRENCMQRIERQRQKVVAAERAWKLLDRLRERDLEEWTYEASREQESLAGDLYLAGWNRR